MNGNATAHIARKKSRVKSYGEKVYLRDGDLFEIELFNGYTTDVLAKIWINDQSISNAGLVLRPGQRYFLERFIDSNNKFQFNTYHVENSEEAKRAISSNGKVRVEFYQKKSPPLSSINWDLWKTKTTPDVNWTGTPYWTTDTNWWNNPVNMPTAYSGSLISGTTAGHINVNYSQQVETGRVESGESSEQVFENIQMAFNQWACDRVEWQILPISQQPVEVNQIRNYCSNCGTRARKASWKFCPSCGTQLD